MVLRKPHRLGRASFSLLTRISHLTVVNCAFSGRGRIASQIHEWAGIQQFPAATQTKLLELLGRRGFLCDVSSMTVLVLGKGGVGESLTVNSLIGERIVVASAFQSENRRPVMVSRTRAGFTLNVIDTPGLIEGGYVNDQALEIIKRFLLNKTIDVLLYVDRLDAYRVDTLDKLVLKAIADSFGQKIWNRAILALTHAQLSPPDGLSYDEFCSRRSEALLNIIKLNLSSGLRPLLCWLRIVEDATRTIMMKRFFQLELFGSPSWSKTMANVVSNGSESILVNRKLIEGPNPNQRGKIWIPIILAIQYCFVVKQIQGAIKTDSARENKPLWELRDMGLVKGKF